MDNPIKHSPKMVVRLLESGDNPCISEWLSRESISSKLEDFPTTAEEIKVRLSQLSRAVPADDGTGALVFVHEGRIEAFAHLLWINWISRTAEVDLILNPDEKRPFFVLRLLRFIRTCLFGTFNLNKMYCFVYGSNAVSLRLMEKMMTCEAKLTKYRKTADGWEDVFIFGLTASTPSKYIGSGSR